MAENLRKNRILVTVLVPCYNMGNKIHRLFDSLLAQTLKSFKVIVIDDGSDDNSKDVINNYREKFKESGLALEYMYQVNAGAASAIGNALKYVDTKYFCLPDADDFYSEDYFERCIDFLESHDTYGIVFTKCLVFYEKNVHSPIGELKRVDHFNISKKDILKDFYWDRNVYFCPNYIIRTSSFVYSNGGGLDIIGGKHGQNYQMILPLAYRSNFGYIDKSLYNYVIYRNSDSHGQRTMQQRIEHINGGVDILLGTFEKMRVPMSEMLEFKEDIIQKSKIQKAYISLAYGDCKSFRNFFNEIKRNYQPPQLLMFYHLSNVPCFFKIISLCGRFVSRFRVSAFYYKTKSFLYRYKLKN